MDVGDSGGTTQGACDDRPQSMSAAVDEVEIGCGAVLVAVTLFDVFQSVVLPRPSVGRVRLSFTVVRFSWRAWRKIAERPRRLQTREAALRCLRAHDRGGAARSLGAAARRRVHRCRLSGGLHDGLQPQPNSFGTTVYFSAGRMLAFPVGGIEATGVATRILTGVEAATGFGLFALVISLLFSLFGSFQRREIAVVALDALAGAPPSGIQLLKSCAKDDLTAQLATTFDEWRMWTVDVLETHLTYTTAVLLPLEPRQRGMAQLIRFRDGRGGAGHHHGGRRTRGARAPHVQGGFTFRRRHAPLLPVQDRGGSRRGARGLRRGMRPSAARGISAARYRHRVGEVQRSANHIRWMVERGDQGPCGPAGSMDR